MIQRRRATADQIASTEADLKPGATVFVPAQRGEDGSLATGFVVVGTNGVDRPM
jgi:hypothetical protein